MCVISLDRPLSVLTVEPSSRIGYLWISDC